MFTISAIKAKFFAVLFLGLALQGCEYIRALSFQPADVSGNEVNTTVLVSYLPYEASLHGLLRDNSALADFDPKFLERFDECRKAKIPKALPPLVGLAVGWATGYIEDSLASLVTQLRNKSQRTYGGYVVVDFKDHGAPFYGTECIVVMRGAIREQEGVKKLVSLGLAAIFYVRRHGSHGMALVPAYLRMKDAIAVTEEGKTPVVNLTMAISISSAAIVNGVPQVIQSAADTLDFGAVPLGATNRATIDCDPSAILSNPKGCPFATRLLARPPAEASAMMISVGVTESGTGLPNAEKAIAELKALRKALGPLFEQKLTEVFSKR